MTDLRTLWDLAELAGQARRRQSPVPVAVGDGTSGGAPRPARPRVADLLSAVMVLSARTRRLTQEPVVIDLDVFRPDGERAVRLIQGELV